MSTHRLSSQRVKSFRLPFFLVLAWLVMALQIGLSSTAFAATRQAPPQSLPPQDVTRAGVSVVRLLVSYTGTASSGPGADANISCTGLGTLVASQLKPGPSNQYENWVLTDGSLVNAGKKATCVTPDADATIASITIYTSNFYNSQQVIKFNVKAADISIHCSSAVDTCADGLSLFSFMSSSREAQPFIDLGASGSKEPESTNRVLSLVNANGTLTDLSASSVGASSTDVYAKQLETYRTPATMPQSDTALEKGTPLVNGAGELVGMHGGKNSSLQSLALLAPFLDATLPKKTSSSVMSSVHEDWKNGMDAYYHQMTDSARVNFQKAFTANSNFQAAQHFIELSGQRVAAGQGQNSSAAASSPNGFASNGVLIPYWQVTAIIALLVLLMLFVFGLIWRRARLKHKRALDDEFADADQRATIEAQRIRMAERESAGHSSSSGSAGPQLALVQTGARGAVTLHCPRCGDVVAQDAYFCTSCQQPLLPNALEGQQPGHIPQPLVPNGAYGSALPVSASVPRSISDQPTIVPAGAIAEQPTVVPGRSIAEQPTVDISSGGVGANDDPEKTVPYTRRQLSGHQLGFVVGTRSDPGIKRKYKPNEDSLFAVQGLINTPSKPPMFGLFVVADGMGGHANGEDASRLAIQSIAQYILPQIDSQGLRSHDSYAQLLVEGVQQANIAVHQNNIQQNGDMGTTVTAMMIVDGMAYVVNVGDSRTYLYHPGTGLRKVTTDHSVVASLVEAGIIKPDDIYTHPKRNQIYRSLGEKSQVDIDSFVVQLQPGDTLLLCSDGLWDMVRDPRIESVIKSPDAHPSAIGDALIQAALEGGGEDNVSVIVVHITEPAETAGMPRMQLIAKPDSVQLPLLQ